ncbi:MAG: hypothetical protein U0166_15910 [Acidobacteriota bacterium]
MDADAARERDVGTVVDQNAIAGGGRRDAGAEPVESARGEVFLADLHHRDARRQERLDPRRDVASRHHRTRRDRVGLELQGSKGTRRDQISSRVSR